MERIPGLIIRTQSGFYSVATESAGVVICKLRGRLKQGRRTGDVVALGDRVEISLVKDGSGVIEEVAPRHSLLARMAPNPQMEYQQIIMANPDQAVFIFACAQPEPHLGMLDRFLVMAEKQALPTVIVANKVDLVPVERAKALFERYPPLGYTLLYTSALSGFGVEALRQCLVGKISAFSGPSGAGKSSLLNAVQPGLGLAAREVSETTSKGRHTTVVRELFALKEGGYVADTPGLKALALWDIEAEELDGYFPEMRSLVRDCQFSDCTHVHEPGCAVRQALSQGRIHAERYQSYLRIRFGEESETFEKPAA